jgi:pimeloyl-ACP methyl ester carboxylesterase
MVLTQLVSRRLTLRSGIDLSYAEQGPADGTPVVLLHGYSDSWRSFAPLMAQLPASFHTFAMTLRGHGDSTKPDAYAMRDFAADLAAFCDRVGIERPTVVGHSMGSLVATRFAIDYPESLGGLVLIGAFKTLKGSRAGAALWQGVSALTDPVSERFVHEFQASTVARPVSPAFLTSVIAESPEAAGAGVEGRAASDAR